MLSAKVPLSEREAQVLERLRGIYAPEAPVKKGGSSNEWERLARERSMQEQATLKQERENLRLLLDPKAVAVFQKHLELCASGIAQMRQDGIKIRGLVEEVEAKIHGLNEVKKLKNANDALESSQAVMGAEIQALQAEIRELKSQMSVMSVRKRTVDVTGRVSAEEKNKEPETSTAHDPLIMIIGGYKQSWLSTAEIYSPKSLQLRPAASMLSTRAYSAASVLKNDLYVFGGGNGKVMLDTTERYDRQNDCWRQCSSMGLMRGNLAGVTAGDRLYALGGGNAHAHYCEVECYVPEVGTWLPSTSMLQKRYMLAAAELNGSIYAVGGFDGKQYLKTMERYDPREGIWKQMSPMSSKRGCLSAAILNGKLYAIGGFDGSRFLSSMDIFDPIANRWDAAEAMACPRGYAAAVTVSNTIHVLGGLQAKNVYCDTLDIYEEGLGWKRLTSSGVGARCFHAAAVI